jgi:hypothetical protein
LTLTAGLLLIQLPRVRLSKWQNNELDVRLALTMDAFHGLSISPNEAVTLALASLSLSSVQLWRANCLIKQIFAGLTQF